MDQHTAQLGLNENNMHGIAQLCTKQHSKTTAVSQNLKGRGRHPKGVHDVYMTLYIKPVCSVKTIVDNMAGEVKVESVRGGVNAVGAVRR